MSGILSALLMITQAYSGTIAWKELPPPREVTEYSVYTRAAKGYMRMISDTSTYKGKPAIRFIVITGLSNIKTLFILRDSSLLYLDPKTWKPLYVTRTVKRPGYNMSYEATCDSLILIKILRGGKKRETFLRSVPEMYENQELFLLLRKFPFKKGSEGEIMDLKPKDATFIKTKIKILGDTVTTDAEGDSVGVVHMKVTMQSKQQDMYFAKKFPYRMIRYEDPSDSVSIILRKKPTGVLPKD